MPHAQLTDRTELARLLTELADHPFLTPRAAELRGLAEDLRQDTDLDQWAELDLLHSFARPDDFAAPQRPARSGALAGLLALARQLKGLAPGAALRHLRDRFRERPVREDLAEAALGVLVFVPLLVTWFALMEASDAYGELSREDPRQASRPFLQLWQSGFGGRLPWPARFGNVALLAVVLITLLLMVAGWHARLRARATREQVAEQEQRTALAAELASVLTRTQLLLIGHRASSPQRFTAELTKAAGRMEQLGRKAVAAQTSLARAAASAEGAATVLQEAACRLADEVPPLGDAAARIERAVKAGSDTLQAMHTGTADAVRGVGDRISHAGEVVDAAVTKLAGVQQRLLTSSQSAVEETVRASRALVDSAGRTAGAVDEMRQSAERWDAAAAHWENAAARLDSGIRRLTGVPVQRADALEVVPVATTLSGWPHDHGPAHRGTQIGTGTAPVRGAAPRDTVPGTAAGGPAGQEHSR
ncbi:hypothetical protein [Peterkaempfera bronchialis]|uniref:Uncharacterized protein n=1 Tax=Peterkaempfera bronchialis TaxID=2126346 RepID=A0A345SV87_9ACTN|nr:hypothetical protein [Peterkaempfera bronchialis]AXI77642.1 hypothetical protein C7M71_009495 [Peterkaempfera bronchialis]